MSALEKVPITKLEKWLNRIATIALVIIELLDKLLKSWQG